MDFCDVTYGLHQCLVDLPAVKNNLARKIAAKKLADDLHLRKVSLGEDLSACLRQLCNGNKTKQETKQAEQGAEQREASD